ncbi:cyclodeaminase/cyclohydrolase family protein [Treponema pedis]|uniref:Formiminotransferase-cyclodeaminase n=1 Tax=Treponema pedis str. T A4 TaxID=1291379 RepID=S5ZS57_9SPIR|nr:cyclodeaminase/cyclohydrolase family protein [Treponema pedis]AGT42895.1 formiminotransferase-cyclodeaminase [Treponema pedis str. T A4]
MKLVEMTVKNFVAETASDSPAPGGGSVSALAGSLSAALGQMVIRLTTGKKAFKELDEKTQKEFETKLPELEAAQKRLDELIDEDTQAFNAFMEALKLPKNTEEEKAKRSKAMSDATAVAMQIPLETANTCLNVLRLLPIVAVYGNKNAASDIGVAALNARSGLEGAILNVKINLGGIDDKLLCEKTRAECNKMLEEGDKLKTEILKTVYSKIE